MASTRNEPRILVIDVSLEILNLYHEVLEEEGYEVELSNYTFESLSLVEQLHPDLIILDFDREGQREEWQFLKLLRLHPPTAYIPIIVSMAPLMLDPHWEENFRHNNIRLLISPFRKEDLLTVIRQVLEAGDA
jgi:CheY-like chemotaxis protein